MSDAQSSADVYRQAERIGTITRTARGSVFEYDDVCFERHKAEPGGIASRLPYFRKRTETQGVNLHPFFAGLLPEGLRLKALVKRIKTSEDDLLSLLIASGTDCIGDISVAPSGQPHAPATPSVPAGRLEEVDFDQLFRKSVGAASGNEPSIPGVQEKISAGMVSFPIRGSQGLRPSIIKLNPPELPRLVENEAFFLQMAHACGLTTPKARLVRDRTGASGLLIERFDRAAAPDGRALQIHQEDACQFLDRYPADKYRLSCAEIAQGIVELTSAPVIEMGRFVRLVAFSYLIGNGDLHGKNISIQTLPGSGRVQLTPSYDLLSTLPYGDQKMALKLEGRDDHIKRAHFLAFGRRYGVPERACAAVLDELVEASPAWIHRLEEIALPERKTRQLRTLMDKRLTDLG